MGKKIIRLTETELKKILKKVIIEQKNGQLAPSKKSKPKPPQADNWNFRDKGTLNFMSNPAAVDVGEEGFTIRIHNSVTNVGQDKPGKETTEPNEEITLNTHEIAGSSLPYPDNMVKPYFDMYPDAKKLFEDIVNLFVVYINNGGGPKLTNVTIKGSADSARPNLNVPKGFSQLDHPSSKPYNGLTDPTEMNQYLADTRASEYAKVLKKVIKDKTGFDLNIEILKGDNFYGQSGKRGDEYRKIILTPNAEPLTVPDKKDLKPTSTSTSGEKVKFTSSVANIEYYSDGKGNNIEGYRVVDSNNYVWPAISREQFEYLGTPIFDKTISSEIKGNQFYVGGKLVGTIKSSDNAPDYQFSTMGKKFKYYVGPITYGYAFRKADIQGVGEVDTVYLNDAYFLFY